MSLAYGTNPGAAPWLEMHVNVTGAIIFSATGVNDHFRGHSQYSAFLRGYIPAEDSRQIDSSTRILLNLSPFKRVYNIFNNSELRIF
jgi:hypothetical protein